ncbi:MAG TPA: plasmid pRiA4b ORF-3 family protein [Anaerolineae bacterium]|nr:plasmid pRiA4b ORF-3 family protein [Anaerolineae bacterium]
MYQSTDLTEECCVCKEKTGTNKVTYQRKPSVWQLIEIAENQTLDDLHYAILDAMRFDADHLYSFFMSGRAWDETTEYASPYGEGPSAAGVKIGDLGLRMKQKFLYLYDYGDEHRFEVQLVGINPEAPKGRYPKIVEKHGRPPRQYGGW